MADAPKFKFLWGHAEGVSILSMPRANWDAAVGTLGEPVEIDVSETPVGGVAHASSIVASVAHQFSPATARLSVFRYDEADAPTPINQDDYDVWVDLEAHPRLQDMINAASTSDGPEFRSFCRENVFLVKRPPGPDHWLSQIPSTMTVVLRRA